MTTTSPNIPPNAHRGRTPNDLNTTPAKPPSQGPAISDQARQLDSLLSSLIRTLVHYTNQNSDPATNVLDYLPPSHLIRNLDLRISSIPSDIPTILATMDKTLQFSVRTGHPLFLDKLYAGVTPIGIAAELLTATLNINTHVFQVSPVGSLMESVCLRELRRLIKYPVDRGSGLLCAGGSMSNLVAMVTARNLLFPHIKVSGMAGIRPLALFTSSHSHFSIDKSAMVLGFGMHQVFKIKTTENGCMIPEDLEKQVLDCISNGFQPFFINATAGTTVLCSFDPIRPLAEIAKRYNLWLHVDGSWGGSVLFSAQHQHLIDGIELSDSFVVNPHKLLGVPLQCSCLLVSRAPDLMNQANSSDAQYLYHMDAEEDDGQMVDIGNFGIGCGRRADGVKLYLSWKFEGTQGFTDRVDGAFQCARLLRSRVRAYFPRLVPVLPPGHELGLNVCFWYVPKPWHALVTTTSSLPWYHDIADRVTSLTRSIRVMLIRRGRLLVDYAPFPGRAGGPPFFFRVPLHSPLISELHLTALLDEIVLVGDLVAHELGFI